MEICNIQLLTIHTQWLPVIVVNDMIIDWTGNNEQPCKLHNFLFVAMLYFGSGCKSGDKRYTSKEKWKRNFTSVMPDCKCKHFQSGRTWKDIFTTLINTQTSYLDFEYYFNKFNSFFLAAIFNQINHNFLFIAIELKFGAYSDSNHRTGFFLIE